MDGERKGKREEGGGGEINVTSMTSSAGKGAGQTFWLVCTSKRCQKVTNSVLRSNRTLGNFNI